MKAGIEAARLVDIRTAPDVNGNLGFIEEVRDLPFRIRRVFYVYGVHPRDTRGRHAHRRCSQFLICVNGSCAVSVEDGRRKRTYTLDSPMRGLFIPPSLWAEQRYASRDTFLVVLADRTFDESDYIRDYGRFLAYRGLKKAGRAPPARLAA